ncbi:MAG: M48 family metallopeptidase [Oscillospiraceae bacterium]|nr:M48 family metallopeptidase [Oscillospiraceae bacterium]
MSIAYSLTRSKRKTVGIYIRCGGVEVRAPLKYPRSEIDKFVSSKEKWIRDNLAKSQFQAEKKSAFTLNYGDMALYRGGCYPIEARAKNRIGFDDTVFYLPQNLQPEQIKTAIVQIYRMLAKRDLSSKVLEYAKLMGVTPAAVKINGAKTRWGSCSTHKSINFSWRLIMADDDVIDYVAVHELAHITEMNHSQKFWAIVEQILPDYKERRAKLKELQRRLAVEDWE